MIIIPILSIAVITYLVWVLGRISPIRICPICAGVSGTWIGMLVVRSQGYSVDTSLLALFIGASVAGSAYQLEKRLPNSPSRWRTPLLWKSLFIPTGFVAGYWLITSQWMLFTLAVGIMIGMALFFFYPRPLPPSESTRVRQLEEHMKNCC